ncbi:MAG: hypothetical protein MJZ65_01020 [Paludibacteraceae bacterium]|nr:hypothetical protein [Paludibacteraceae bacterium]
MTKYNSFSVLLLTVALVMAQTAVAQKRIVSDNKSTVQLTQSDAQHFTKADKQPDKNVHGLMSSSDAGVHHSLGMWLNGAYSAIVHDVPTVSSTPGGYDAGLGFVYEMSYSWFLLQVGAGAHFQGVRYYQDDYSFTNSDLATAMWDYDSRWLTEGKGGQLVDSYGLPIDVLTYQINDRRDVVRTFYLEVPVLFGGAYNGFYGLLGAKLNMALWGKIYMQQNVTSTAVYNQFNGVSHEMDNHGYRNLVQIKQTGKKIDFRTDVLLSAELGYEFRRDAGRYRLGAYVDYGLLNLAPSSDVNPFYFDFDRKWNFDQFEMTHVFASALAKDCKMHNLFAGIKFTMLFSLPERDKCILCEQAKKSSRR